MGLVRGSSAGASAQVSREAMRGVYLATAHQKKRRRGGVEIISTLYERYEQPGPHVRDIGSLGKTLRWPLFVS